MNTVSPLAGKPAPKEILVDVTELVRAYYDTQPDVEDPNQLVICLQVQGHDLQRSTASLRDINAAVDFMPRWVREPISCEFSRCAELYAAFDRPACRSAVRLARLCR